MLGCIKTIDSSQKVFKMKGDVAGVRIIPPTIEFADAEVNVVHKLDITVKNISKVSKSIRFYGPQNKEFVLKVKNPEIPIAAGLEVSGVVEYCTSEKGEHRDRLVLTVDGDVIEIPLVASPCKPSLSLEGPVDFGQVVASSRVISREVVMYNNGSKDGEFKIKYAGDKPISIVPSSGSVPAKSAIRIKIEYVTKVPGEFNEYAKVKLEGREISYLQICGSVVEGALFLLSPDLEQILECVDFGCTYYGTDKTESAVLYNCGPEPVSFVTVLDENAVGQEVGVDLTKSTSAMLFDRTANDPSKRLGGEVNDLLSLVTAIPNQGVLGPYEKMPIFFRFSPRWNETGQGFNCKKTNPPRKDFAIFVQIKVIGASPGFQDRESDSNTAAEGQNLEVALTATALPVVLTLAPSNNFDFGECSSGDRMDMLCTLTNDSPLLPVSYQFRRIAHFTVKPSKSKIQAGHSQELIFSFAPHQAGTFKPIQYIDIMGTVADNKNPFLMQMQVIQSIALSFMGKSDPAAIKKGPVFNPGITPKITNEVGLYTDVTQSTLTNNPSAAVLSSHGSRLHKHKVSKNKENERKTLVAFPNDRASSIRPSNRKENYRTVFTHAERHTYVDPDYTYTDDEADALKAHKQYYKDFIDYLRDRRKHMEQDKEFKEANNSADIGIKPAAGIKPKKLNVAEVGSYWKLPQPPNEHFRLLSMNELAKAEMATAVKVRDGLNAIPTSAREKADCQKILSPIELHQIMIGPPTIDFKRVCLRSISHKEVTIVNNLDQFAHVVVHIDCKELRQTSPLSQVIPPKSKAVIPVIFESNVKGKFQRSVDYVINGFYKNHLTVFAEVVPVALELSSNEIIVEPTLGLPAEAGIRGVVTLKNPLNLGGEFTWAPILGERGTAFSIRPATGVVNAYSNLDCEIVFHPSFMAPEEGMFALQVHGGNTLKLKCSAKIGTSNVQFVDRRVVFGQVPLHLSTTRVAMIRNSGVHHAYFQVVDPSPFPGLQVAPLHGVIPVGGVAELAITLTPNAIIKFDTRLQVAIRGGRTLELRMSGAVEPPCADIDISSFNFGGVPCTSEAVTSFQLKNLTNASAKMEFDLSRYSDFSLKFPGVESPEDFTLQLMNPGIYSVTMASNELISGELYFRPTEVASYDFVMPVTINQTHAPSPTNSPIPPTPVPGNKARKNNTNPKPMHVVVVTPSRKVIATALRQPMQISSLNLDFVVSPDVQEMVTLSGVGHMQMTSFVNKSDRVLNWSLDLRNKDIAALEEGVFKFLHSSGTPFLGNNGQVSGSLEAGQTFNLGVSFCPPKPGYYEATVPIVVNNEYERPFTQLTVTGLLKSPKITFDPLAIVLTPTPLHTAVTVEFRLLTLNYTKKSLLQVEVPQVEGEDGSLITPLAVTFMENAEIKPETEGQEEPNSLRCSITFASPRPVSFSSGVKFIDDMNNVFTLPVTATADNCLLTCYPFLAQHRTDHQIVCEQGTSLKGRRTASNESINVGEAILIPCGDPPRPNSRPSTTATSSNFEVSSSSYESGSQSVSDSSFPDTPRDGALNKFTTESEQQSRGTKQRQDLASRSLGSAVFPEEDTEEGIFHAEVLLAVQRWFSAQGWPTPNPIFIPNSLRSGLSKKPNEVKAVNAKGGTWEANNVKKECKTVYDMITHLCGKQIPGIPNNSSLPVDQFERAKQIYWQHSTLLSFLKTQGSCVASIKPEYLMEPRDYKVWVVIQKEVEMKKANRTGVDIGQKTEEEEALEDQLFEAVSKRAWTDVLLQILKVLVLSKITPRKFRSTPHPYKGSELPMVDPNPLCSNVYSVSERILLLWLNHNYEQQRHLIWKDSAEGAVPPSRWIVNFDFDLLDGLVLATILAAHAPFLIQTHLGSMYTQPTTAEQCLHNALKVVHALHYIGIEYDIQAIDITDPNPVSLLLLCHHLYETLPQYLPQATVEFVGGLHQTVLRQVKLSNPSSKPLTYTALVAGWDAQDFSLPRGSQLELSSRSTINVPVEFISRFLRPSSAVLVLVGRRQGSSTGTTLVFNLYSLIDNICPKSTIRCEAPCYEVHNISVAVTNPFPAAGKFKVILVENQADVAMSDPLLPSAPATNKTVKKKPSKRVRSRVNYGQQSGSEEEERAQVEAAKTGQTQEPAMQSFHCSATSVYLDARTAGSVEVEFLPFQIGKRQCMLVFANDEVGEFIYAIEANALLPKPINTPVESSSSIQITSAAASDKSLGQFGGKEDVIYWRCETGQTLKENIPVPVVNEAAEQALLAVAQQNMTDVELHRRRVTGTLECATVTTKAVDRISTSAGPRPPQKPKPKETTFIVEVDSKHFSAPKTLTVPVAVHRPRTSAPVRPHSTNSINLGVPQELAIDLPVTFHAQAAGHYPCRVVLTAPDDVRVYNIECVVIAAGSEAELEFTSPVHQSVTQDIPVVNQSTTDWYMEATIEGGGFTGPTSLVAKAYSTTFYPLIFRPQTEGVVQGQLTLYNPIDGVKQRFILKGTAEAPLPLEQLVFHAQVKQNVERTLQIPNMTRKKLCYKVSSDLPFITGPEYVTVLPGKSVSYPVNVNPQRRGHYRGVLSFVAGPQTSKEDDATLLEAVDSDGDEVDDADEDELHGYTVWYSLEAHISPSAPEKTISIRCPCQKQMAVEVGFTNPTGEEITLAVEMQPQDIGLNGSNELRVRPKERGIYQLLFAPAVIGPAKGSLIFYSPEVGEFWYNLELHAEKPIPTQLPHMDCELGRWVRQNITLNNPTGETLYLFPTVSNNNNFVVERDNEKHIELGPHSSLKLPLTFMPSNLGPADHRATITFHCEQLGEWTYYVSGSGCLPQPQDPVSVTAIAGSNSTLIIPFRNPLDDTVIADIIVKDKAEMTKNALDSTAPPGQNENEPKYVSPFCLLMKHDMGVGVGPKNALDIPVSFAPQDMKMSEAMVLVSVKKENGEPWRYDLTQESNHVPASSVDTQVQQIEWQFPVKGYPELLSTDTQPALVMCQARERLEERLEVSLTGVAPAIGGPKRGIKTRAKSGVPRDQNETVESGVVVGETIALAEEFSYELVYKDDESKRNLDSSVALSLVRQARDKHTGLVVLVFNVIYAPYKPMSHDVQLLVKGATGGIWRFQLRFTATEPEPDDCITIEALGLNKESSLGFRLTSQAKHPVPYNAFFIAGSDPEFSVSPNSGELLPVGTNGTLIKVLFTPQKYGKFFQGKLVVQTADMQWTYNVRGVLPDYVPPMGYSSVQTTGPDPRLRHERVNFIRENMRMTTTAVSSPIKGAPIIPRMNPNQILH